MMTQRFGSGYRYPHISYNSTIMPRLSYTIDRFSELLAILKKEQSALSKENKSTLKNSTDYDKEDIARLETEKTISFAIESLNQIYKKIQNLSTIDTFPTVLPSAILVIRTISASLYELMPKTSHELSELSTVLGSVVMDSGTITGAKFDFAEHNNASWLILDEAKLMVDSKINKQYPNLDFPKLADT